MWFTRLAVLRPIVIAMLFGGLMVLGLRSMGGIPAELNPRVEIPTVLVATAFPGAGPEEVEALVSKPVEDVVTTVSRVKDIYSSSQESLSVVTVDFEIGTPLDTAAAEVRERVEGVRMLLPDGARTPVVSKLDLNALPVMTLGLTGARSQRELRALAEDVVKYRLGRVPGVASIAIVGGVRREIRVDVDRSRLETHGLTLHDVLNPLRAASVNVPGGSITQGPREYGVRAVGEFAGLDDIRNVQIPTAPPGGMPLGLPGGMPLGLPAGMAGAALPTRAPLTLSELAVVRDTNADPEQIARLDGKSSVSLVIYKASDANTVKVADGVRGALGAVRDALPKGVQVAVAQDQSKTVREALEDLNTSLVLGSLLAVLVVYLFLHNVRGMMIVAVAIPTSIISTFLVMWAAGFTFNQMTMLGLSLSVGILVDDSILVLESIYRHLYRGASPREAALNGRAEVNLADISNTLVDVIVFVPIAFMGGIVGQFFREFGIVVAVASLFSLVVSLSLTPMMASRLYRRGEDLEARAGIFVHFDRFYRGLDERYRRLLGWALRRRPLVIAAGAASLMLAGILGWKALTFEFIPPIDQSRIAVTVETPIGSSLAATDALVRRVEEVARRVPEAAHVYAQVGAVTAGFGGISLEGPQYGQVMVQLRDKQGLADKVLRPFGGEGLRKRTDDVIAAELRGALRDVPGARLAVAAIHGWSSDTQSQPFMLQVHGADLRQLHQATQAVRERIRRIPGILNLQVSLRVGRPEVQVRLDRDRAAQTGIFPAQAALILRDSIAGNTEVKYREKGREYDVRVQLASLDRRSPDDVARVVVGHTGSRPILVRDVADVRMAAGPIKIDRKNRLREATLTADLAPGYPLGNVRRLVDRELTGLPLEGVSLRWAGEAETMEESARAMVAALLLAILLAYMLMAALFNSFVHPLTIMLSLPMALVGAILALALLGESLSIVSMIGFIMLVGLVAKNAILLVDYINTLRARGLARDAAVQEAGPTRLRPILMTTLSTTIAMLPVAVRFGRASEMRAPMAVAVIGGLLLSTLLTLVIIPVVYTCFDDLSTRWRTGRS